MTSLRHGTSVLLALGCLAGCAARAAGQGARVRPRFPHREIPWLDFSPHGVWRDRAERVRATRARMLAARQFGALNRAAPLVSGTIVEPVVLLRFQDVAAPPYDTTAYDSVLYAANPPNGRPYTVRTYYEDLTTLGSSPPLISIRGKAFGFVTLDSNEVTYTGDTSSLCKAQNPFGVSNCNGIFSNAAFTRFQSGLQEALAKLDNSVDWNQFSSHGGTIDLVVFVQPAKDGACGAYPASGSASSNGHIWSHRSFLEPPFPTHSGLKVVDYIIESGVGGADFGCDINQIMPVGTVAHETGHGFNLPDLYDTQGSSEGVGEYSLMGSGNYTSALSPSRMDAWSLSQLGWVTVVPLTADGVYTFGGAPVSDTTFYVGVASPNPRGEYFLVENRQPLHSDSAMIRMHCQYSVSHGHPSACGGGSTGGGLLVWHVDSTQLANHGFNADNAVNAGPIHGLELVQADGLGDLDLGTNRGDAGDPYPGSSGNQAFSLAVHPLPTKNADGTFAGFGLSSIQQLASPGMPMTFQLHFGAPALTVQAVVAQLLLGSGLMADALTYLDLGGNRNSQFDLGDFLAWVDAGGAGAGP